MKLYVAGPMTGCADFNYPAFRAAGELLKIEGYEVLNPVDNDPGQTFDQTWQWYMKAAIRQVIEAEGIALLPGWEDSRGARLECSIAEALGLEVATLESWLAR